MKNKRTGLDKLVRGRGNYVVNQKSFKFADRRTRRGRSRGDNRRNSINEAKDEL